MANVLQKHNWQLYIFGSHHCVIPCNPMELFKESEVEIESNTSQVKLDVNNSDVIQINELENNLQQHNEIIVLLKQLANTLLVKNARQKLAEI